MQNNPLNCLRCRMTIKQPVRLHCQHYFCRSCVDSEKCHVCGRAVNLAELNEDKVLNYVIESSREATETCANCDQVNMPMFFCETCQQPLCCECRETTHKAKIFFLHHIVQLEERGRVRNRPFCSSHNEPFILFCLDSKSLMCIECFNSSSLERRGHFVNIDVAHKICCDKLEKSAANLRNFHIELREQIELRRRLLVELEKNGEDLSAEIVQKCEEIINRVNSLRENLLNKVIEERAEKEQQINSQLAQFLNLESPVSVNLLSISIFCSYASKIDVLHCYSDLYKSVQQFLLANGQHIQKVKFDCAFSSVDFASEFNQMINQPMGFLRFGTENNIFLNCESTPKSVGRRENRSSERNLSSIENNTEFSTSELGRGDGNALINDSQTGNPTFLLNTGMSPFNTYQTHLENDNFMDSSPRFADQFHQISAPLSRFTQEISLISKSLQNMQRDITLRRCVVNPEELITRITCCEHAWDQLEAHNKQVQNILNHCMGQMWRKEIGRVQKQQQAVREKVDEMKQLQRLAQRALKFSQQLKPFATQMASLISVIDNRRSGEIAPSPMEQICLEISQIAPDSESRVAAIEKEEELRRLAKLEEERSQFGRREAVQAKKSLKEVRLTAPKQPRAQVVVEMDRDRVPTSSISIAGNSHSCLSSPLTTKRRNQLQSRAHRNSESSLPDLPANSPSNKLFESAEMSLEEQTEMEGAEEKNTSATIPSFLKDEEETTETVEALPVHEEIPPCPQIPAPSNSSAITASILRSQTQDRDPALLSAKEKLLESIKNTVKRID